MRRARQRRLRAALPWALTGGVLVLAAVLAWIVLGTGVLGVREQRVTGANLVTPAQVRAAAAVPDGVPLARVDLAGVRARVTALAPVDRVNVSRAWPDTLVIEVVERTPVAVVPQGKQFVVVDGAGVVFQTLAERPADLPLARVATPGRDDAATRAALQVLASLTPDLRRQLTEVVVDGPARIKVLLRGNRTVIWGDATGGETKARVATSLLARRGDTIDVSAPDVVTIR
jgi:cell division protein FtsQ